MSPCMSGKRSSRACPPSPALCAEADATQTKSSAVSKRNLYIRSYSLQRKRMCRDAGVAPESFHAKMLTLYLPARANVSPRPRQEDLKPYRLTDVNAHFT